jgi:hyperosmotically inducible periplasmic protein
MYGQEIKKTGDLLHQYSSCLLPPASCLLLPASCFLFPKEKIMIRRVLAILLLLVVALAIFLYFSPQGRAFSRRVLGFSQTANDLALTNNVRAVFSLSKRLSAYAINVETRDGVVTLSGQVPTEIDKDLAANVAKDVSGVKSVDNQLQVQLGLKPSEASVREGMRITDLEIRADLNERLVASQALQGQNVQVSVQDRIVTLTGQVETPAQKTGAEQLARGVANVVDVANKLTVSNPGAGISETPASKDKDLANRVMFALFNGRDDFVDIAPIKVTGREGTVFLTGSVSSKAERALAERIARDVDGVKGVNNQLSVTLPR